MLRRKWKQAEEAVAKRHNGRVQPASGAKWFAKGDVVSEDFVTQVKSTHKKQYTLTLADLDAMETDAAKSDKNARMVVTFFTPSGPRSYRIERDWTTK